MYENRQYVIFEVNELNKINFDEVLETSAETIRLSINGSKTFVKWNDNQEVPASVQQLTTKSQYLTHEEIIAILSTEEWTSPLKQV